MFSKMPLRNKITCKTHFLFCGKLHNIFSDSIHGMDFQLILCMRKDLITYMWQLFGFYKVSCSLWYYSQIFVCYFRKQRKITILLHLTTVCSFSPTSLRKILHQNRSAFKLEKENSLFFSLCCWFWFSALWNLQFSFLKTVCQTFNWLLFKGIFLCRSCHLYEYWGGKLISV